MRASLSIDAGGEKVALLPPGAAWWERGRALIVADLHLEIADEGGSGTPHADGDAGVPAPAGRSAAGTARDEDLEAVLALAKERGAARVVVVGDFLDASVPIDARAVAVVADWRDRLGAQVWLALGNQDGAIRARPDALPLDRVDDVIEDGPFVFVHYPASERPELTGGGFRVCGHMHPVVRLEERRRELQLRCFVREARQLILPSFGRRTGGAVVEGAKGRRRYPVTGDEVLDLGI